jgi:hypothetical protein
MLAIGSHEEGYLAGGGVSYIQQKILEIKPAHKDEGVGHHILHGALHEPFFRSL